MREIKFRVWDDDLERMDYFDLRSTIVQGWLKIDDFKKTSVPRDVELYDEDSHIMQYTGLKDIKGKEIYEGDIVKWLGANETNLIRTTNNVVVEIPEFYERLSHYRLIGLSINIEVIGNIYENKELLE